MTESELRLECLKLAIAQARVESRPQDLDRVAEIQTRFYDGIVSAPQTVRKSKKDADKAPEIFG